MAEDLVTPIFDSIVALANVEETKKLSREARAALDPETAGNIENYRYANLTLPVVQKALDTIKLYGLPENSSFVDIGSGVGHALFAAALCHPFSSVIGCEALEPLHLKGKELEAKYYSIFSPAEGEAEPPADLKKTEMVFVHGDFQTKIDELFLPTVSVICCVATCFDDSLLETICAQAREPSKQDPAIDAVKPGTFCITITKHLPDTKNWEILSAEPVQCSWGEATLFIQRKKGEIPVETAGG